MSDARLRPELHEATLRGLSPNHSADTVAAAVRDAGFERLGRNLGEPPPGRRDTAATVVMDALSNLPITAFVRARRATDVGQALDTAHASGAKDVVVQLGSCFASQAEAMRTMEIFVRHAERAPCPVHVALHRATITRDVARTCALLGEFPDVGFSAAFAEWYLGHEMIFGSFRAQLAAMTPVFARVTHLVACVGTSEQSQIDVGDGRASLLATSIPSIVRRLAVRHAVRLWREAMARFVERSRSAPSATLGFCVQLPPMNDDLCSAGDSASAGCIEEGDRVRQSVVLARLGARTFASL